MHTCSFMKFQEKFNTIFSHLLAEPGTAVTDDHLRSLMFGDYLSEGENKVYDEVDDLDSLQKVGRYAGGLCRAEQECGL